MKEFDIFEYKNDGCLGFPVELTFYYKLTGNEIGFIEIYRNGKMYTNMFNGGINIKHIRKMLKIANKERIKRIIMTRIKWGKE